MWHFSQRHIKPHEKFFIHHVYRIDSFLGLKRNAIGRRETKISNSEVTPHAHILDDCDKDTYVLGMAVDFIKGWEIEDFKLQEFYLLL
jgi:hypothetical protein